MTNRKNSALFKDNLKEQMLCTRMPLRRLMVVWRCHNDSAIISDSDYHLLFHPTGPLSTMPHRPGEICERCRKHIHPQTATSAESTHSLPACATCLPLGVILLTCGGCKLTRYCVSLVLFFEISQVLNYLDNKGKPCQKAHRQVHKESCEINMRIKQCARNYGPETEAMYLSFAQWCEDNAPVFSTAAFNALGISLDRQNACKSQVSVFWIFFESLNTPL